MKNFALWSAGVVAIGVVATAASGISDEARMPDLNGGIAWINSAPLSGKALRGKVVLVNFWTYSCINSLRELPYMKAWAAKYKDAGLVVIGVHSPEFEFEREPKNVKNAVSALNITYPIPIDSNHSIWTSFRNEYWPADYFIDARGRIRYHHFGEGEYEASERAIKTLLKENGATGLDDTVVHIAAEGPEAAPSEDVRSTETYVGYARAEHFASSERVAPDARKNYKSPAVPALNEWGLSGSWKVGGEKATLESTSGRITFRFHARDLHMVLGPAKDGHVVRFRVAIDGAALGDDHGADSGIDGKGEVRMPRMYQLVRQKGPVKDATFEIEFLDAGVEAFSFTFG